jgi:hypothetical protein
MKLVEMRKTALVFLLITVFLLGILGKTHILLLEIY